MHRPGIYSFLETFAGRLLAAPVSVRAPSLGLRGRCQVVLLGLGRKTGRWLYLKPKAYNPWLTLRVFVILNPDQLKNNLDSKGFKVYLALCAFEMDGNSVTFPAPLAKR